MTPFKSKLFCLNYSLTGRYLLIEECNVGTYRYLFIHFICISTALAQIENYVFVEYNLSLLKQN